LLLTIKDYVQGPVVCSINPADHKKFDIEENTPKGNSLLIINPENN